MYLYRYKKNNWQTQIKENSNLYALNTVESRKRKIRNRNRRNNTYEINRWEIDITYIYCNIASVRNYKGFLLNLIRIHEFKYTQYPLNNWWIRGIKIFYSRNITLNKCKADRMVLGNQDCLGSIYWDLFRVFGMFVSL